MDLLEPTTTLAPGKYELKAADGPQSFSHTGLEMDAAIEKGEDAYLHIFSEDDAVPLKAKIRVAAEAEVWFMDLKEYE